MHFAQAARAIAAECTCIRARQAARALTKLYDEALRPAGIQTSQVSVLVAVAHFGEAGASIHALADVLGMDRSTLSRNLRPLEKLGLLRVARSPEDARLRLVLLTKQGERVIERVYPLWQRAQRELEKRAGSDLPRSVRESLKQLLDKVASDDAGARCRSSEPPR
jgi:DNA-binding MarR family transcriptional regulator